VRPGRFVRLLPEGPDDVRRLWDTASPLDGQSRPDWVDPEDEAEYRLVGPTAPCDSASADEQLYAAELELLESVGFVVDPDSAGPGPHRIFVRRPRADQIWSIGVYEGESPCRLRPSRRWPNPVLTRRDVTDVPAAFVADPFLVFAPDICHMFFEVMNWRTGKGEIGWATSQNFGPWQYGRIVLEEPFHLSYPYVFEWHGEYYLVPETHQAEAVYLYRAASFPTVWVRAATLLDGAYFADASLFAWEGRWWMFVDASSDGAHDTLRLFAAESPLGRWCEHPSSPIVSGDARCARPAGRVVCSAGRPIRFAQNCSADYGLDVRAFEIAQLTPTAYAERALGANPILSGSGMGWNSDGMHHLDPVELPTGGWLAAVDGWTT
jgi:hypothetical protein